ncbi:MAG: 50S ribosomal protein L15 [Elusimicrobia bacterium]|nr:50S ribosomal protein L15 [Candidatus Liberimonas magnetica]
MGLNNLKPAPGSKHRKKIVGRGEGSGHGGQSGRGMKGQKGRSGDGVMTGFEGGQMPLVRRIPKRGFTSRFRKNFAVINIEILDKNFKPDSEITPEIMRKVKIVKENYPIKVLGNGEIKQALKIKANAFSKSAIEKIKASGGTAEIIQKK